MKTQKTHAFSNLKFTHVYILLTLDAQSKFFWLYIGRFFLSKPSFNSGPERICWVNNSLENTTTMKRDVGAGIKPYPTPKMKHHKEIQR
jgi:hypothetical protein